MSEALQSQIDTIVALSTPHGRGAIAIIRLSGPQALPIAQTFWSGRTTLQQLKPRVLSGGWVVIKGERIDSSLVAVSHNPKSYTGEDMVELHVHGSPAVVHSVLEGALKAGARLAEPGEFTRRALLNGKLDAAQTEAVADLVEAESTKLVRLAADQLAGGLSHTIITLVEKIVSVAAQEAAYLDFSEEDIASENSDVLRGSITECIAQLQDMLHYSVNIPLLRDGVRIALIGFPNAGKSTLLNAMVGFDRSIVTDVAGTTRDTIDERIMIGDVPARLTDTAGLNPEPDVVEAIGIERTHATTKQTDIALVLVAPGRLAVTEEYLKAHRLIDLLKSKDTILVYTKSDLDDSTHTMPEWAKQVCNISAATGLGMAEFMSLLASRVHVGGNEEATVLTTQRQIELARGAVIRLNQALKLLDSNAPRDIILVELEAAAKELSRITGADTNDAMLDDMFSRFCIGK